MNKSNKGFSLVEILTVVIIVAILMGLTASAAFSARQRAYVSSATVEAEQLVAAFKSYWMAKREWPMSASDWTALDKSKLGPLIGEDADKKVYISIPEKRFEEDSAGHYLDPWGNPYYVKIDPEGEIEAEEVFETVVSFPNQFAHYYDEDWYTVP